MSALRMDTGIKVAFAEASNLKADRQAVSIACPEPSQMSSSPISMKPLSLIYQGHSDSCPGVVRRAAT